MDIEFSINWNLWSESKEGVVVSLNDGIISLWTIGISHYINMRFAFVRVFSCDNEASREKGAVVVVRGSGYIGCLLGECRE